MREREKRPEGVPSIILVLPILLLSYTLLTVQLKYYFCSSPMTFPMFVRSNIVYYTASLRYDVAMPQGLLHQRTQYTSYIQRIF